MNIQYVDRLKRPSNGDVKTLKNGDRFIRRQRQIDGMYVVSNGKPDFEWYAEDHPFVAELKSRIDTEKLAFRSESADKPNKGRTIHVRLGMDNS